MYHRAWIGDAIRGQLAHARDRVLLGFGVGFPAVHPPIANPWSESPLRTGGFDVTQAKTQMVMWKLEHWFEPSWFEHADDEIEALAEVIEGSQRAARHVVIVLMPESSVLRAAVPVTASAAFRRALARVHEPPPVFDLRAMMPDTDFADHIHVNAAGASLLSARVAALVK